MSTIEEKQRLQRDAGLSNLPTDLTYDLRRAISGEGDWDYQWEDKPHRLVYSACSEAEAFRAEVERLGRDYNTARDAHDRLLVENERLRAALKKINVGDGWAALIARAALTQSAPQKGGE